MRYGAEVPIWSAQIAWSPCPVTVGVVQLEEPVAASRGAVEQFWRRLRRDRVGMAAGAFLIVLILAAIFGAPLAASLTGHPPDEQYPGGIDLNGIALPPLSHALGPTGEPDPNGEFFILGTDRLGRDQLVRLLYGARISLLVAFTATGVALLIGVPLGLAAGFFGGRLDNVISRGIETAMAFPSMLFAVGLAAVIGPGLLNVIIVIALFSWYYPARMVRSAVLSLKHQQFVEAAVSIGASDRRIMLRHLLPQLTAPIIVYATGIIAANILFEAGLSFLGLGVPPPTPSWGQMLADGVADGLYRVMPWGAFIPGFMLMLTMLAFNQFGDALRDAFAPRAVG
jgi:peptide/nickel transport system permease protein